MQERVYEFEGSEKEKLKKLLSYDPYSDPSIDSKTLEELKSNKEANIIFARQNCLIRDAAQLGIEGGKLYLYIKANDDFIAAAEGKLAKDFPSMRRVAKDVEEKVVRLINEEESRSNYGVGLIFGG